MSDDAVDKFFDEMVSPASTPTESWIGYNVLDSPMRDE